MKKINVSLLIATTFAVNLCQPMANAEGPQGEPTALHVQGRAMEKLSRGMVAVALPDGGNFVSWRLLASDPDGVVFHVLRNGEKITSAPLKTTTCFVDKEGAGTSNYAIEAIAGPRLLSTSRSVSVWNDSSRDIELTPPEPWVAPDSGKVYAYSPGDASVGDLDGDGELELVFWWKARHAGGTTKVDSTSPVYLEAIKLNGKSLWRINFGINVQAGAHYNTFVVADFNSDGFAEVMAKTSDGTVDATGKVLGKKDADHRNAKGRLLTEPEWLTVFDGRTGAAIDTVDYVPQLGDIKVWGDDYGNRAYRFLSTIAYVDGKKPSAIFARGYYHGKRVGPGRTAITAWDFDGKKLKMKWAFDTHEQKLSKDYIGQGNHSMASGDVDGDGCDEILFGSMAVDHDGTPLFTTGLQHGDAHHFSDLDPERPGLEFFMPHEKPAKDPRIPGVTFRDAATGEIIWSVPPQKGQTDVGRGACADFYAGSPGAESWWSQNPKIYSVKGQPIGPAPSKKHSPNFFVWWDGDLTREILNKNYIAKYNPDAVDALDILLKDDQVHSINGTKATPVISGDLFGDWREEVVWVRNDNKALRIYTTMIPTQHRMVTLMHDPIYRLAMAAQQTGYNQPPHTGFFLGSGMTNYGNLPGSRHIKREK